ncbi:MAG: FeoB-associated Cys-rich membrane protein [Bacillota bacterium]
MLATIIAIVVIVIILGSAIAYIVRAKKKGVKCIGCPAGSTCNGHCGSTNPIEQQPKTAQQPIEEHKCNCANCTGGSDCKCGNDDKK